MSYYNISTTFILEVLKIQIRKTLMRFGSGHNCVDPTGS